MLKRSGLFLAMIILTALLAACTRTTDTVETPADNSLERGRNYKEVIEDFEDKGFTNIRIETIEDLIYGQSFRNGEVERITVGGDINYDSGVWVPMDTEVVITYHTFSQKSIEEAAAKEQEELEKAALREKNSQGSNVESGSESPSENTSESEEGEE